MARIGSVTNGYSNYLAILAIDAQYAASYGGPGEEDDAHHDFDRAIAVMDAGKATFTTMDKRGKGILAEIGGCGSAQIHRFGDALVLVDHHAGDDDVKTNLDRVIATHPTTKPKKLGTVEVTSGALALFSLVEPGKKVAIAKAKKPRAVTKIPGGCVVAVKPGRYDLWQEQFTVRGTWGVIEGRIRIVPAGTKLVAGAPIANIAPVKKRRN